MNKYLIYGLSCVCAFAAEPYVLEKSTISASGFEQDIREAPATINVITDKELESKPYRDIAEVISDIPGVDLYASKGKTGAFNITMRGITGYTLVLIDGRRQGIGGEIGPNGFGETLNATLPPLSSIERIEVIKGPMSTLYGSEALGGVINIITKKVGEKWGASISVDALVNEDTSWGNTYSTGIVLNGPLVQDKLGLTLRFRESYREQSRVEFTNSRGQTVPANQAQSPTKANNFNVGGRLNYIINSQNNLSVDVDYSKNHYNNANSELGTLTRPGDAPGSLTGGYTKKMDIEKLVTFIAHEGIYENFSLNSGLQYNRATNNGREVVGQVTQPFLGENRGIKAEDIIADTKAVVPIGQRNILSVGVEYRLEKMHDKIANPTKFDQYLIGVFAEDELSILDSLRLTLGARYNKHQIFGNNISPRAYLVYNASENLTLKGGVSTGFKAPYANRLIPGAYNYGGQGRFPIYGNPNLKEETSINYEVGVGYTGEFFHANVTGFLTTFDDKISTKRIERNQQIEAVGVCTAPRCFLAINHGKVEYKGVEFGAGVYPLPNLVLDLSYTFLDTEVKKSSVQTAIGKPENNSLKHNIITKASYTYNKLTPWIKGEWQLKRAMNDNNLPRDYYRDIFLASAGLSYAIHTNWSLNLGVYNLLNKSFTDAYETYVTVNSRGVATTTYVNTYNRIEEGRRYYISLNGRF